MKVIGSGFGRTGTLSMKSALEQLGFGPCYHMFEVISSRKHTKAWYRIAQGQPADWHQLFQEFESAVDFPASIFYEQLLAAFPEAKVVHTIREPERWYTSTRETIYLAEGTKIFPAWAQRLVKRMGQWTWMTNQLIWSGLFEGAFEDRQRAIEIFNAYTEKVKQTVPADRLLIFNVKEGWEPLCQFLDVPVPDTPFPHVNDRESILRTLRLARIAIRLAPVVLLLIIIVALSVGLL